MSDELDRLRNYSDVFRRHVIKVVWRLQTKPLLSTDPHEHRDRSSIMYYVNLPTLMSLGTCLIEH